MTFTKVGGGLAGALLIFLLLNWAGDLIYFEGEEGGEGKEAAYVIEVEEETPETETAAEEGPAFGELVAMADLAKGKKVFNKCASCHKITDGANGVGPFLFAVLDRDIGSVDGYSYSGALMDAEGVWSIDALNAFLTKPKEYAPGTKMGFSGIKKESDRANLIAYLATLK